MCNDFVMRVSVPVRDVAPDQAILVRNNQLNGRHAACAALQVAVVQPEFTADPDERMVYLPAESGYATLDAGAEVLFYSPQVFTLGVLGRGSTFAMWASEMTPERRVPARADRLLEGRVLGHDRVGQWAETFLVNAFFSLPPDTLVELLYLYPQPLKGNCDALSELS